MAVQIDDAPGYEEQLLWCIVRIDNLSIVVLHQSIEQIEMRTTKYQQTRYPCL